MAKTPLGKLPPAAIGMLELPRLSREIIDRYRALDDLTGTTSDAMDQCGIEGTVPGSILRPTDPSARLVAQAPTVLNRRQDSKVSRLGEIEAHNLAQPGDVASNAAVGSSGRQSEHYSRPQEMSV